MYLNRRPNQSSARARAALALTLLWSAVANPLWVRAQVPPFPMPLPACYAIDSPDTDAWPRVGNDSIGTTAGAPITFSAASLLANDVGTGLTILSVGPDSAGGGTITGAGHISTRQTRPSAPTRSRTRSRRRWGPRSAPRWASSK
jgi:hypothetical protein